MHHDMSFNFHLWLFALVQVNLSSHSKQHFSPSKLFHILVFLITLKLVV